MGNGQGHNLALPYHMWGCIRKIGVESCLWGLKEGDRKALPCFTSSDSTLLYAMRKFSGYILITALLGLGIFCALFYIRAGNELPVHAWSGGELRVGYSSEPPYAFRTPTGDVTGEAPEIAKVVLEKIGVKRIRWVLLDFNKAIPALLAGHIDMIANGLFITPERATQVLFSLPYCSVQEGLLVHRGNPFHLTSYEAAANSKVRVAVLDGSVEQRTFTSLGLSEDRLFVVPDPGGGLAAVRAGLADCLALSAPTIHWLAGEAPDDVEPAVPFYDAHEDALGQSAFAFRREDGSLAEAVNSVLREYIGSPEHLARVTSFGFGPEAFPLWRR